MNERQSGPPLQDKRPGYQKRGTDVIKRTRMVGMEYDEKAPSVLYVLWRDGVPIGWYESAGQAREAAG